MERGRVGSLLFTVLLSVAGCASQTYERYNLPDLGEPYWDSRDKAHLPPDAFQFELTKDKAACLVEKFKLQIPSPSCVQPPKQNCSGMTGFALGFCQGYSPSANCDYSAVNAAKAAQNEIYKNCLISKGWTPKRKQGSGSDTTGGVFEKITRTADSVYFIKLGSAKKDVDSYKAIVRMVNRRDASKSYQGLYAFDATSRTFTVDGGEPTVIEKSSPAELLLKRLKKYKTPLGELGGNVGWN